MKKRTVILLSSLVFTFILMLILHYRGVLIMSDPTGYFHMEGRDWIERVITYLPEFSIIITLIAIYTKKAPGLILTVLGFVLACISFAGELFVKIVKITDVINTSQAPVGIVPWFNIPVIVICIILFLIKFHIFTIPNEVKFKL